MSSQKKILTKSMVSSMAEPPTEPTEEPSPWDEIRVHGKNIARRSCHSAIIHQGRMYVYGGYDINTGIMNDFNVIDLSGDIEWQTISMESQDGYPGRRCNHTAVVYDGWMIVFGGKVGSLTNTDQIQFYNFKEDQWVVRKTTGPKPKVDSHTACVFQDSMYVFGGFEGGAVGCYSNALWRLDLQKLQWRKLEVSGKTPAPRANSSCCILNNKMYIFGGGDLNTKYNDLWIFDFEQSTWTDVPTKANPLTRHGHTMTSHESKLILFGGIHDITHQLNDVCLFEQQWTILEEHSAFQPQTCPEENQSTNISHHYNVKKSEERQANNHSQNKKLYRQLKEINYNNSNTSTIQAERQQKSKQDIKKQYLLSQFELTPQEKQQYRSHSPTLQSLKNSIVAINSNNPFKRFATQETQLQKMKKNNHRRRPCARDGHTACLYKNALYVFGGDRHMMGFNDLYRLDLNKLDLL